MEEKKTTTPNKEAIESKAIEMFFADQHQKGFKTSINPELEELKESGYFDKARVELMRSQENQFLDYLEQMARENGFELVKVKETEYSEDLEPYPVKDIMKEGCFVVGGRGSGKTNLLKLLVLEAINAKIRVKVFDSCLAWKGYFLHRIKVKRNSFTPNLWNRIYDLSRLSVLETRDFVGDMLAKDVEEAIISTDMGFKPSCLVIIEEAQNVVPSHSLRSKKFLEISRFITQGRNFGMSFIASTQRLASVDINLVEISGVKYFFKLEGHRNLTKTRYWLDKFTTWKLRELGRGECYIQVGAKLKLLRLPRFKEAMKVKA